MTEERKQELIATAAEIRKKHRLGAVAPIKDIAELVGKHYKCKINIFPFKETDGFYRYRTSDVMTRIDPKTKRLQMAINKDQHLNAILKVRLTIAYEFAHYLLGYYDDDKTKQRNDNINLFIKSGEIAEANFLAAELLMPGAALEGDINVQRVAEYYRVTQLVVQYRKSML